MLILRVPKEKARIKNIVTKYRKNLAQGLVLGDIAYSDINVYIMVPDEALSAAFLYGVYLRAREWGLDAEAMYALRVDLDAVLPEDVKKAGIAWASRRPTKKEVNALKSRFITGSLLEVLLR